MYDEDVKLRPILGVRTAVDAMDTFDPGEYSDGQLAAEVLCIRREMDRLDAVFARLTVAAHRPGVGTG